MKSRVTLLSILLFAVLMVGGAFADRAAQRASIDRFSIGDEPNQ